MDISHRLKRFVIHFDRSFGLLEYVWCLGNDQAYRVSDHPCRITFSDHHIPVLLDVTDLVVRNIRCCKNTQYARQGLCLFFMDLLYYRPWIIGTYSRAVCHRRHICLDDRAGIAAMLTFPVYIGARFYFSPFDSVIEILFAPSGLLHYELRSVLRDEVFRTDIIRVFTIAEDLFPDVHPEDILADSVY